MKKMIGKIMRRFGYKKMEPAELHLLDVGLFVVEHYINDRKYRRSLKDTRLDDKIKSVIQAWTPKDK
tara:strand:+ start:1315 stop:1515 length:201 start_codon:yes stop_codon:yes gene_type:complete